ALPPAYLQLLAALGRALPVHLFVLQPSREFWADIAAPREQARTLRRAGRGAAEAPSLHLEAGNRLLASLGTLGRDFQFLIEDAGDWEPHESFTDLGCDSLLRAVQSDILNLCDRGVGKVRRLAVKPADDSIQIHSCHSPVRELE